jgi:hypothetical protein
MAYFTISPDTVNALGIIGDKDADYEVSRLADTGEQLSVPPIGATCSYDGWYENRCYLIRRGILRFDTSVLDGLSLISASIRFQNATVANPEGVALYVVEGYFSDPPELIDYGAMLAATTVFASINFADIDAGGWNDLPLSVDCINDYLGDGQNTFGLRCSLDVNDVVPTAQNYMSSLTYRLRALVSDPTLQTNAATKIQEGSATLNGEILDDAGFPILDVYFEYGKTTAYGSTTPLQEWSGGTKEFSADITGLEVDANYHFRMCIHIPVADSGSDYVYGLDRQFTGSNPTLPDPLTRITGLVHRYDRRKGIYQLEIHLGDVTTILSPSYTTSTPSVVPPLPTPVVHPPWLDEWGVWMVWDEALQRYKRA